jgi:hypothetical protein
VGIGAVGKYADGGGSVNPEAENIGQIDNSSMKSSGTASL